MSVAAGYLRRRKKRFFALFMVIVHIAGAPTSIRAIMYTRTSQGAVAWAVSLNTFPYLSVPAYWIFGNKRFDGDITKRRGDHEKGGSILGGFLEAAAGKSLLAPGREEVAHVLRERLARLPATTGNDVELLRNGDVIFPSIFDGIDSAKDYVLLQFYIIRDDLLGNRLKEHLTAATKRGVKVIGPAVQTIQFAFWEDWLWASDRQLALVWDPQAAPSGAMNSVLCIAGGPADPLETCTLYFLRQINSATKRLWIASPYFVPDEQIITALELAALRGVEVRILIPDKADDALVDLSGWAFVERLAKVGVNFYRHTDGFMHQKVTLVDSDLATVGTTNFDNRSFRHNFEMTLEIRDEAFARKIATMLENDFAHSRRVDPKEITGRGLLFLFKVRASHLLSPIQ